MKIYEKFLPKNTKQGKIGYYPVASHEEWEELPAVYKAMEWFPVEVSKMSYSGKMRTEKTFVKNVVFDVPYLEPYGVSAKVSVHRQEVQKILFCLFPRSECHLYTVCEVEFENGERRHAKWWQDSRTGAYAIYTDNHCVGKQGGYQGHIPAIIAETEAGFEYKQGYNAYNSSNINHYEYSNPFKKEVK